MTVHRMNIVDDSRRKFSNHRQWREFMAETQSATAVTGSPSTGQRSAGMARQPLGVRIHIAMRLAQESNEREAGLDREIDR